MKEEEVVTDSLATIEFETVSHPNASHIVTLPSYLPLSRTPRIAKQLFLTNMLPLPTPVAVEDDKIEEEEIYDDVSAWVHKEDMIRSVFERISDLQEEGVTRTMKSRAVIDLFKYLNSLGLSPFSVAAGKMLSSEEIIFDWK